MKTDLSLVAVMVCYGMLWYDMKAEQFLMKFYEMCYKEFGGVPVDKVRDVIN